MDSQLPGSSKDPVLEVNTSNVCQNDTEAPGASNAKKKPRIRRRQNRSKTTNQSDILDANVNKDKNLEPLSNDVKDMSNNFSEMSINNTAFSSSKNGLRRNKANSLNNSTMANYSLTNDAGNYGCAVNTNRMTNRFCDLSIQEQAQIILTEMRHSNLAQSIPDSEQSAYIQSVLQVLAFFQQPLLPIGGYRPEQYLPPSTAHHVPRPPNMGCMQKQPSNVNNRKHTKNNRNSESNGYEFPEYMNAQDVQNGLSNGTLFSGNIRINKKNFQEAFLTHTDGDKDVLIESVISRNRALEDDCVVVEMYDEALWKNGQRTGRVVALSSKEHPRTCVGSFKLDNASKASTYLLFAPRDYRVPRLRIPVTDWPEFLHQNKTKEMEDILFFAKIIEWTDTRFAVGTILKSLGKCGSLETETVAILLENDLDGTPHGPEMEEFYHTPPFYIPEAEFSYRRDCRDMCIFTIDPATAKDLDDAVSCQELPNGNFEIGVHISDVGYFLAANTILDEAVGKKATTIYMVESVYHMLPKPLCMMCSLLPGEDKLAFSVFWEFTKEGEIVSQNITRTVINSCAKLSYEHAQEFIENPTKQYESVDGFPTIFNDYELNNLRMVVTDLQNIAVKLRTKRFENGALRIDQPKLSFELDPNTSIPTSFSVYEIKESHRLIEEFMLLANCTVAQHLSNEYPQLAFLRFHHEPIQHLVKDLKNVMSVLNIELNTDSAGAINKSLQQISEECYRKTGDATSTMMVMNNLCSRSMTRALYFCASGNRSENEFWHYALNVPRYTHFTSPIRRYADIMVHRQLAHSLGYENAILWDADTYKEVAGQCNKNKFNAKKAGEMSIDLYLRHYIAQRGPLIEPAVVLDVKERVMDVLVLSMGTVRRINFKVFPTGVQFKTKTNEHHKKLQTLVIDWGNWTEDSIMAYEAEMDTKNKQSKNTHHNKPPHNGIQKIQIVTLFSKVNVRLWAESENPKNIEARLLPPS